jgi:ribose transport system ATP-binding protein
MTPFLQARQIEKSFPPNVTALRGVDLKIQPGQVHCLLGANGAGKSTLLKIIAGAHQLDEGELLVNGQRRNFASPLEAARNGISMIYQELDLIPQLTVAENLFLGRVAWARRGRAFWTTLLSKTATGSDPERARARTGKS